MIVLGADTHERSHTIAAVAVATGEVLGEKTVQVGARGLASLLVWARGLDGRFYNRDRVQPDMALLADDIAEISRTLQLG